MLRRLSTVPWHYFLVAAIIILMTPLMIGFITPKRVIIKYDQQEKEISTIFSSEKAILEEAGIALQQGDGFHFEPGHNGMQNGCVLTVVRGVEFEVIYNGERKKFKSSKATVTEALKDVGIKHKGEKIYPLGSTKLHAGLRIYVVGKNEHLHLTDVTSAPPVTYVDDRELAEGVEKVDKPGKPGKTKVISKLVKNADGTSTTIELGRVEIEPAENKVIRRGTALSVLTPEGFKRYSRKLTCDATAYSGGGYTATGVVPYRGVVAVDPDRIPLGTRMFIPGYGMAVAADTGGDMVHHRIDVYLDTETECFYWGRREVEVYLLEDE